MSGTEADDWNNPTYIRDTVITTRLVVHELLRIIGGHNPSIYGRLGEALEGHAREAAGSEEYRSLEKHLRRAQTYYRVNSEPS